MTTENVGRSFGKSAIQNGAPLQQKRCGCFLFVPSSQEKDKLGPLEGFSAPARPKGFVYFFVGRNIAK